MSIVKPTAVITDKEAMGWSLSWQPAGRCDSFTREAILSGAPPTSGVYGLFNFDCQIFIGESENIQEVLLRLESEPDFQSPHLRPTGFTFEPCSAELRKLKAADLIARFRPVLQTEAALTEMSSSDRPMVNGRGSGEDSEVYTDDHDFPVHEPAKRPADDSRFLSKLTLGATFAAVFVAITAMIIYLGTPTDDDVQNRVNGAGKKSAARISLAQSPVSDPVENGSSPHKVPSIDTAGERAKPNAEGTPARQDGAVRFAATKTSGADEAGAQKLLGPSRTIPAADPSGSVNVGKKWSVQISAAPAKDVAENLAQQLIAKGYDSYVIQAEVKGQTYYRVRVGHFAEREAAESIRQSLARQEGYRQAYLTGD